MQTSFKQKGQSRDVTIDTHLKPQLSESASIRADPPSVTSVLLCKGPQERENISETLAQASRNCTKFTACYGHGTRATAGGDEEQENRGRAFFRPRSYAVKK